MQAAVAAVAAGSAAHDAVPQPPHKKKSRQNDTASASGLIALINEVEEDTEGVFDRLMLLVIRFLLYLVFHHDCGNLKRA